MALRGVPLHSSYLVPVELSIYTLEHFPSFPFSCRRGRRDGREEQSDVEKKLVWVYQKGVGLSNEEKGE